MLRIEQRWPRRPSGDDTIVDVPAGCVEATLAAQLATIARKLNQIIDIIHKSPG